MRSLYTLWHIVFKNVTRLHPFGFNGQYSCTAPLKCAVNAAKHKKKQKLRKNVIVNKVIEPYGRASEIVWMMQKNKARSENFVKIQSFTL